MGLIINLIKNILFAFESLDISFIVESNFKKLVFINMQINSRENNIFRKCSINN